MEARVRRMYEAYAPEKLDNVPMLLAKYGGALDKLISALVEKYGPEPSAEAHDTMAIAEMESVTEMRVATTQGRAALRDGSC